jgi:hypothetical protein
MLNWSRSYTIVFLTVTHYFILNMFVGVIVATFSQLRKVRFSLAPEADSTASACPIAVRMQHEIAMAAAGSRRKLVN